MCVCLRMAQESTVSPESAKLHWPITIWPQKSQLCCISTFFQHQIDFSILINIIMATIGWKNGVFIYQWLAHNSTFDVSHIVTAWCYSHLYSLVICRSPLMSYVIFLIYSLLPFLSAWSLQLFSCIYRPASYPIWPTWTPISSVVHHVALIFTDSWCIIQLFHQQIFWCVH